MLVLVAGDDKLADSEATLEIVKMAKPGEIDEIVYPENYHENFNELNRNEVFARMVEWVEPRLGK